MNTAEILAKAADVIEEVGWYQGDFYDQHGTGVCALAALYMAVGLEPWRATLGYDKSPACRDARSAGISLVAWIDSEVSLTDWNDEPGRTAGQVTSALRACAAEVAECDGIRRPEQLTLVGAS